MYIPLQSLAILFVQWLICFDKEFAKVQRKQAGDDVCGDTTLGARTRWILKHTKMTRIEFQGTVRFSICIYFAKMDDRENDGEEGMINIKLVSINEN